MVDVVWLLTVSLKDLLSRKTRTMLTVLGIAVGIALLFSLIALVSGVESQSAAMIRRLTGADITLRNVTLMEYGGPVPWPLGRGFGEHNVQVSLMNQH